MATITKKNVNKSPDSAYTAGPYGNVTALPFKFKTDTNGYFLDSDTPSTAVASGDVVRLGLIPKGAKLLDMIRIISDAFTTATTGKLGFQYADGVDSTDVPQDDDYFSAATSSAATAITRKTATTAPVILPKDAYLILTVGGATHASAGVMDINVLCELMGPA